MGNKINMNVVFFWFGCFVVAETVFHCVILTVWNSAYRLEWPLIHGDKGVHRIPAVNVF